MGEWQPIETAPNNTDEEFLVCSTGIYDICHAVIVDGIAHAVSDGGVFHGATHWQPLPDPPTN